MSISHDVALHLGTSGLRLDVWDRYELTISMLRPGSPWCFSLFKSYSRQSTWGALKANLKLGERVMLSVDGALQMNGYIGRIVEVSDPDQGDGIAISGRDLSGPALRFHADPKVRLKGLPLEEALARLFQPIGVAVRIGANANAARQVQSGTRRNAHVSHAATRTRRTQTIDHGHPQPGETIWQVAEAICRRLGYLIWCAPDAEQGLSVVVDTPAYSSDPLYQFERVSGRSCTYGRAEHTVQIDEVPTVVTAYADSARGDTVSARGSFELMNGALLDPSFLGGWSAAELLAQPMHVQAERARGVGAAQRTAERIVADANAHLRTLTLTVQGHGQPNDDGPNLYAVNTMATVRDDHFGFDERMLVQELVLRGGADEGASTTITLGTQGAIALSPEDA